MTRKEKNIIRAHWSCSYCKLRFRADGSVEGKKSPGGAWGLLYTGEDACRHIQAVCDPQQR